jgi:TrmH family RNA methyltransferase
MLSKNRIKFVQSLARKKKRDQTGLFIVEGIKALEQMANAEMHFHSVYHTGNLPDNISKIDAEYFECTDDDLKKISQLKTPQGILAICHKPKNTCFEKNIADSLVLVLDNIQDPGNMCTIIRLASWFGISQIICSEQTADCYNPKVVQSAMGALAHVQIHYTNIVEFIAGEFSKNTAIFGTYLQGENIYQSSLAKCGIVILGNEGNGIRPELEQFVSHKITIPSYGNNTHVVESLNVSTAASIVLSEFSRRMR